jgi:hypothetical protein
MTMIAPSALAPLAAVVPAEVHPGLTAGVPHLAPALVLAVPLLLGRLAGGDAIARPAGARAVLRRARPAAASAGPQPGAA